MVKIGVDIEEEEAPLQLVEEVSKIIGLNNQQTPKNKSVQDRLKQ